jgi:hypothetical protein
MYHEHEQSQYQINQLSSLWNQDGKKESWLSFLLSLTNSILSCFVEYFQVLDNASPK